MRLIRLALSYGAEILVDLEDSIQDFGQAENNHVLKKNARHALFLLSDFLSEQSNGHPIHVRINNRNTPFFDDDLKALAEVKDIKWKSVFLPKTESYSDLENLFGRLNHHKINYKGISPIIETRKGVDWFLEDFATIDLALNAIFFGNYDYNLSCGTWPIVEQDSEEYWQLVSGLIVKAEKLGYKFGNSPYAKLGDSNSLNNILEKLSNLCELDFYQVTLANSQSQQCRMFSQGMRTGLAVTARANSAVEVQSFFHQYKLNKRGFAFDRDRQRIITPQEYLLSLNHKS
jgi:hypothetical protein